MCKTSSSERSFRRRKLGKYLSISVLLLVAVLAATCSQLSKNAANLQEETHNVIVKEEHDTNRTINKNSAFAVHRNISLNITNRTAASSILADYNVSLCTQIRDEPAHDVIEWLTYYRLVHGVKKVCIIDDASTIDYGDIFAAFSVHSLPSRNDRNQNWDLCRKCLGISDSHQRIFISDVDEFLFVQDEERFAEYLQLFSQISIYTLNFGNAHESRDGNSSLVLQNTRRAPHHCLQESYNHSLSCRDACWYDTTKSFMKDAEVKTYLTHSSNTNGISVLLNCHIATMYHYFIRSQQEFFSKFAWDEDSKWHVKKKYEHVLENMNFYTAVTDNRLKRSVLEKVPDYDELLKKYKKALLVR